MNNRSEETSRVRQSYFCDNLIIIACKAKSHRSRVTGIWPSSKSLKTHLLAYAPCETSCTVSNSSAYAPRKQWFCFQTKNALLCLDILILQISFLIMKINKFWSDLNGVSAKSKHRLWSRRGNPKHRTGFRVYSLGSSAFVTTKISGCLPEKYLFLFKKNIMLMR